MRLLVRLTCASIVFSSPTYGQSDLEELCRAWQETISQSRSVCAFAKANVDAYRRDHGQDFRKAKTPQQAGQIINETNAHIAELQQPCTGADANERRAHTNVFVAGQGAYMEALQQAKNADGPRRAEIAQAWLRKVRCLPAR